MPAKAILAAGRRRTRRCERWQVAAVLVLPLAVAGLDAPSAPERTKITLERALAATVSDAGMAETVRTLVSFGPRMYGTPSNHDAAAWLATAFKDAGLDVAVREDTPRMWYQSVSWEIRVGGVAEATVEVLETTWPGTSPAHTVVATLPGRDRSKHILFCAHGDADSGGPGANDNASGVAIVLEIAHTLVAAVKAGSIPQPAWDLRFASWGGEISSTREYVAAMSHDASILQAVLNYDQSGFGSWKEALYIEPDDIPVNTSLVTLIRQVITDHLGVPGFPERAASNRSQGGTDSYVFQNTRDPKATLYPSVTLYTSAWGSVRQQPITPGFPPVNWYADEKPGVVTIDGDAFYHSVGDTAANTTDKEPHNMGWCARVGLLTALRLMAAVGQSGPGTIIDP